MKTKLLLFFAVMLHCTVYCQLNQQKPQSFRIGVRGALAHSKLYGSKNYRSYPSGNYYSLDHDKFLVSYSAGIWAGYSVSQVSIVTEVNLTEKGQQNEFGGMINSESYYMTLRPRLKYICMPIMLQYNCKNFNRLGLYGGLEFAWLISAKQEITGNFEAGTTDIKSDFQERDLGIVAGLNFLLLKGTMIDIRFVNGLEDISPPHESTSVTNRSLQIGFKFFLAK